MSHSTRGSRRAHRGGRRFISSLLAVVLAVGGAVLGTATVATAAPEDALIVTIIKPDGTAVQPGEIVDEGTP